MTQPAADLDELVESWTIEGHRPNSWKQPYVDTFSDDETYKNLLERLEYLSRKFFSLFIPALFPPHHPNFLGRLWNWLNNDGLSPLEQRLMFELAGRLAYFSFEDFVQLYRSAYVGPVARWIIDQLGLKLTAPHFTENVETESKNHTWYCGITDSMVISEFYHANGLVGIDQRPAFRSMQEFSEPRKLVAYMRARNLKRLVLLEDFVGTGNQSIKTVEWAAQNLNCPVLFVPLIVCPDGLGALQIMAQKSNGTIRVEPVLCLDESVFVVRNPACSDALFDGIADLAKAVQSKVADPANDTSYGPFGYHNASDNFSGATVVLFSNTPDNTLPLIHHHEHSLAKWQALFPRVSRETT